MNTLLKLVLIGGGVYLGSKAYEKMRLIMLENKAEEILAEEERKERIAKYLSSKQELVMKTREENSNVVYLSTTGGAVENKNTTAA